MKGRKRKLSYETLWTQIYTYYVATLPCKS